MVQTVYFAKLSTPTNTTAATLLPTDAAAAGAATNTNSNSTNKNKARIHPSTAMWGDSTKTEQRTNIENMKKTTSDSQTGVWLQSILSAQPDWLERDEDEEADPYEDNFLNEVISEPTAGTNKDGKRKRSSFRGMVQKIVVSKRISPLQVSSLVPALVVFGV